MSRPSAPRLTRESVVAAALAIVDADGAEALSTRRLAAELGVSGPSLYHHFSGKEEIVAGIVAGLYGQISLTATAPDWKGVITDYAQQLRAVLARHPHVVDFVIAAPVRSVPQLQVYEHVAASLVASGISPARCRQIIFAADSVVVGALAMTDPGLFDPSDEQRDRFPTVVRLTEESRPPTADDNFAIAFGAFLAGLDSVLTGSGGGSPA